MTTIRTAPLLKTNTPNETGEIRWIRKPTELRGECIVTLLTPDGKRIQAFGVVFADGKFREGNYNERRDTFTFVLSSSPIVVHVGETFQIGDGYFVKAE